jgi:hypothetical protein
MAVFYYEFDSQLTVRFHLRKCNTSRMEYIRVQARLARLERLVLRDLPVVLDIREQQALQAW